MARAAGFDNISLDLMMWLPEQSVAQWLESMDALDRARPGARIDVPARNLSERAAARRHGARPMVGRPRRRRRRDVSVGFRRMDRAGYVQYEISNAARPGRESRHNLKYWTDGEWLGFGCGAHSTRRGVRWKNVARRRKSTSRL